MGLFRKVLWNSSCLRCLEICSLVHRSAVAAQTVHKHFTDIPAVQFGREGMANRNQQWWHYLAVVALPSGDRQPGLSHSVSQQRGPGPAGTPGEALSSASLSKVKISENLRPTSTAQHCTASSVSKPSSAPSLSVESYLYPPNIMCPPQVSTCVLL